MEHKQNNLQLVEAETKPRGPEFNAQAAARAEAIMGQLEAVPGLHDGVGFEGKLSANGVNIIAESTKTPDMQWRDTCTLMRGDDDGGVQLERTAPLTGGSDMPATYVLRGLKTVENSDGSTTNQAMEYTLQPGNGSYDGSASIHTAEGLQPVALSNDEFMAQVNATLADLQASTARALAHPEAAMAPAA